MSHRANLTKAIITLCFASFIANSARAQEVGPLHPELAPKPQAVESLLEFAWNKQDVTHLGPNYWPQFRGPTGDGHAITAKPPVEWSEEKNVAWKIPIHGQGWSSPIVWGDRIWLTTASNDGKKSSVLCVELSTGKVLIDRVVFENDIVQKDHHATNSYASPTPVTDGKNVYVHFGAYGTAALDSKSGDTLWERRDLPCNHFRGPGSSPVLFGNLLIFHMDGFDFEYVVALDKNSGKTVWMTKRDVNYGTDDGDIHKAYSTPTFIRVPSGIQMISPTSKATIAYDPFTGKSLWRVRYEEFSTTAKALFDGDRLYISSGFSKAHLLAVRPGTEGDITSTNVDWDVSRGISCKPSNILAGDVIFTMNDQGILGCIRKKDGEQLWQERLGGDFSASPIVADGKLYLFDHEGKSYVYQADDSQTRLSMNELKSGCRASPVAVGDLLIVRTVTDLYCFRQ